MKLVYGGGEERREGKEGALKGREARQCKGNVSKSCPICNYGISDGFGTNWEAHVPLV